MIITGDCELRHSEQSTQMTQELKVITTETHSVGPLFYSLPSIFVPVTSVRCVAQLGAALCRGHQHLWLFCGQTHQGRAGSWE